MSMTFLYRVKDTDDRDCCAYIEQPCFECGHYFSNIHLNGACYCGGNFAEYADIETVLTKKEYQALIEFNKKVNELGYCIEIGSDRYNYGMELCAGIQPIFDRLNSEEGREFYDGIVAEEKQIVMDEYNLTKYQVDYVFENYPLSSMYQDSSIIGYVYDDSSDLGYNEAYEFGYMNHGDYISERYFDYEKFGEDLVSEQEEYLELDDGRVIYFMM